MRACCRYGFPFDRHEWLIDRGGKEVRYCIDYYYNPKPPTGPNDPLANVAGSPVVLPEPYIHTFPPIVPKLTRSIYVDVRPCVDDASSLWDRLKRFPGRMLDSFSRPKFHAEGIDPSKAPKEAAAFALHSSDSPNTASSTAPAGAAAAPAAAATGGPAKSLASRGEDDILAVMDAKCKDLLAAFKGEADPTRKQQAHMRLNYCMATVVCPADAKSFMAAMEKEDATDETREAAFSTMSACVLATLSASRQAPAAGAPAPPQMH